MASQKITQSKKRKIKEEGRLFNQKWTNDYFFVETNGKAICLICREVTPIFKDYNLKRHYIEKHDGLNHRQFQEFLKLTDADYGNIIYFSEVRWLSRGKMLTRFYELRTEIKSFMESKTKPMPELDDEIWLTDLAFLVDITTHLNELNTRLQGENQMITSMFQNIIAFEMKLKLWKSQVKEQNFIYFPTLAKHEPFNTEKYSTLLLNLEHEFASRFKDFRKNEQYFNIFATPFSVIINSLPLAFQMECIELQCDIQLKEKFNNTSLLDFYKIHLPRQNYPALHNHALFMSSLFGSTYICEQLFSRMKHTKNKIRSTLLDEHLEKSLRIATTSIEPNYEVLISKKQSQKSH